MHLVVASQQLNLVVVTFIYAKVYFRFLQANGFKQQYETDVEFADNIHKIASLPFLEPTSVVEGFELLCSKFGDDYPPILDYIEDTYIGRVGGSTRREPMFPVRFWNMHNRVLNNQHRTNNKIEAWHRKLNCAFQCYHPTLWTFLDKLIKEENSLHSDTVNAKSGREPAIQKQYESLNKRLHSLVETPHPTVYEQLQAIGRLLDMSLRAIRLQCMPDKGFGKELDKLDVLCINRLHNCTWSGKLKDYQAHLNERHGSCDSVQCSLTNYGCHRQVMRKDFGAHLNTEQHQRSLLVFLEKMLLLMNTTISVNASSMEVETIGSATEATNNSTRVNDLYDELQKCYSILTTLTQGVQTLQNAAVRLNAESSGIDNLCQAIIQEFNKLK
ncbi:unnamed protein product, partial [Didymodactylos carnosus]